MHNIVIMSVKFEDQLVTWNNNREFSQMIEFIWLSSKLSLIYMDQLSLNKSLHVKM